MIGRLVVLLLAANLGWLALAQGWLQPYVGLASAQQREPQRLAAQLQLVQEGSAQDFPQWRVPV